MNAKDQNYSCCWAARRLSRGSGCSAKPRPISQADVLTNINNPATNTGIVPEGFVPRLIADPIATIMPVRGGSNDAY
jgi:hypothetical protein